MDQELSETRIISTSSMCSNTVFSSPAKVGAEMMRRGELRPVLMWFDMSRGSGVCGLHELVLVRDFGLVGRGLWKRIDWDARRDVGVGAMDIEYRLYPVISARSSGRNT